MKHVLKSLALAAALVAVGAAHADTVAVGGSTNIGGNTLTLQQSTGGLYFSNGTGDPVNGVPSNSVGGLVGALNIGKVVVTAVDGANVTEVIRPIGTRNKTDQRANVQIDAAVSGLTYDNATGNITNVTAIGGALQTAAALTGILEGGTLKINNLKIDLTNKAVYADVLGNAGETFESNNPGLKLWTFDTITGPKALPSLAALNAAAAGDITGLTNAGFAYNAGTKTVSAVTFLNGLKVTADGFNAVADALGLSAGSTGYDTLNAVNDKAEGWGSLKSTINFNVSAVPEPESYAMALVGLVVVGGALRRRRANA